MFHPLANQTCSPVDPKKLEKAEHHLCADLEGRVWLIDVHGIFYFTEPGGLVTTRMGAPGITHLSGSMNRLWYAPCEDGFIVQSKQHGLLRVSTQGVWALHDTPGEYRNNAIAVDTESEAFIVLDSIYDSSSCTTTHQLSRYTLDAELLDARDPSELMGVEVNTTTYNAGLALSPRWLVIANANKVWARDSDSPGATITPLDFKGDERIYLSGDLLWSHSDRHVHQVDLVSHERTTYEVTACFEEGMGITAVDFASGVAICKERHGDQRCRLVQLDDSGGVSAHALDEVIRTKRLGRIYGIHVEQNGRLWLASGRGKSTRFLIFDARGKSVKFDK